MAKSGRDSFRSTLVEGYEFVFYFSCSFCEREGQQKDAVGYCSDCREYLCAECFKIIQRHKRALRHQPLDQQQMPKDKQQNIETDSRCSKGGFDFVYENCCDLCEREKKAAVRCCSNCCANLCTECFRHHSRRPKPSCNYILLDQHQMFQNKQAQPIPQNMTIPVSDVEARMSRVSFEQSRDVRKTRAYHVMDVPVFRSISDDSTPAITGCVVLPGGKLVLVDYGNYIVQLVDLTRGDVVSHLKLSKGVWGITRVRSTIVAVTSLYEETIYVVKVGDILKLAYEFKVHGQCRGIACIDGNLLVSYAWPMKVEIISTKGAVLQTVITAEKGRQLSIHPVYIAVSKDQRTIYISDDDRGTVTSIDLKGRVQATYRDDKLKKPQGLTVDTTGAVYVCGLDSINVFQLTADLAEGRQLLQRSDAIVWPFSVYYCAVTDRLYVGMMGSSVVKVFQFK